jgi:hypothetical protein
MIMALSDAALATVDDVKSFYQFPKTANRTIDNDLIEDLINRITQFFHGYCGTPQFKSKVYTEYYDGDGYTSLFIHNYPIISITSMNDDSDWGFGNDTLISSSTYRIVDEMYIVLKDYSFTKGTQNIKVVYTAGYETIPRDLNLACIKEVVRAYKNRKAPDEIFTTIEGNQVTRVQKGLLEDTTQVLNSYMKAEIC